MNKKGKILLCLLPLATAVCLLVPSSRTIHGISDGGAYRMATESEDALAPWIWFDMSGSTVRFTSSMDSRISLVTRGTVEFHRGKVYTISDNGKQIWIFDVPDNDTLVFLAEGSTIPADSEGNAVLFDGAQFKRIDE